MVQQLTFGLLAICKDEAVSMVRMLESAELCGIKTWCITDTGSTDNTPDLIAATATRCRVRTSFEHEPWQDFSTNRNSNLERARRVFPEIDYWLALDADESVSQVDCQTPTLPARMGMYHIHETMRSEEPQTSFQAPRLIKGDSDFRYRGRCHEVLFSSIPQPVGVAPEWHIDHWSDGNYGRQGDGARMERNLALLKHDLRDPDADKARTIFYTAMTHERGGNPKEAERWFKQRWMMEKTWEEERWQAHYRMGCCQLAQGNPAGVDTLLRTIDMRPYRAEPLLDLAAYYHMMGCDALAQLFMPQAPFPYPIQDALFIREELYGPPPLTHDPETVTVSS
jgi:hypothetical protein